MQLQATQVRAARAILNWSQEELADRSGIGITTIRQIESGYASRRNTTINLRGTFESAGLEFIEHEGVRRRADQFRLLEGADSCQKLYEELLQAAHSGVDEILAFAPSYQTIAETLGLNEEEGRARVKTLRNYANIKCLVHEGGLPEKADPLVTIKYDFATIMGRTRYYVYGGKHALIIPGDRREYQFVIFNIPSNTQQLRQEFQDIWSGKKLKDFVQRLKQAADNGQPAAEDLMKALGHASV